MKNWKFTVIHHPSRRALGLDQNEYSVFDLIYKTQTHPDMNVDGWCSRSYRKIADDLGIGVATVHGIVDRGVALGFLEVNPANPTQKKTLSAFYDIAYLEEAELEKIEVPVRKLNVRNPNTAVRIPNADRSDSEQNRSDSEHYINKIDNEERNYKESGNVRLIEDAVAIVEFFNFSAGRRVSTAVKGRGSENVGWVASLLRSGYTREEIETMILFKCWEWKGSPKMEKHLEPITIFKRHGKTYIQQAIEASSNPQFAEVLKRAKANDQRQNGGGIVPGEITRNVAGNLANW